nr:phytanoyl-CoA dioxygenase family protein [Fibrobacterota bacterium]
MILTDEQLQDFWSDGFVVVKGCFDAEEIGGLRDSARSDRELDAHSSGRADGEGGTVRLSVWNHPGEGIYGAVARCRRIVDSMEKILGGEVYHYHSKMILKDPKVGGAWTWHQDYGYWYHNSVLAPIMASAFIAVDRATRENGCLQLLKGSHHLGRLDHVLTGEQAGADAERVREAVSRLEL